MRTKYLALVLLYALMFGSVPARAFETDQYNLSPEPLADVGDEFAEYVRAQIGLAIADLNSQIADHTACLELSSASKKCRSRDRELKELAELRSPDAVAEAVYDRLGKGNIFTSKTGKWLNSHEFAHQPPRYKTSYIHSIFVTTPVNYATISPTMRMYGSEFGTDKIDHFFQQGYKYFEIYRKAVDKGKTPLEAEREAVNWGKKTERLFFGMLVSGVYSNADLFANYAGMKFYLRLTDEVVNADGSRLEPILMLTEGQKWTIRDDESMIRPFIADHMNEALNPSGFSFLLYPTVRRVVRRHACPEWRQLYPNATTTDMERRSSALEKWNGDDYGFTHKSKTVPIAVCFENEPTSRSTQ